MLTGTYRFPAMESVVYRPAVCRGAEGGGRAARGACRVRAGERHARRARPTWSTRSAHALGNRLAGVCAKIGAHTPRIDVVEAANAARAAGADLLVTLGGGSVTDAAKMVALCLGNDITEPAAARQLPRRGRRRRHDRARRRSKPPAVRTITIPTTLSAGEYTASAGCTDTVRHVKESFGHPLMMPKTVMLDPRASVHTPEWLFLSTGIRAVDHAVEDICSPHCQPISEGASFHALKLLGHGLRGVKADPLDLDARLECQLGAWMSMVGSQTGVPQRREPRHRPCARRHRACAARLYLVRDAAACAALQPPGQRRPPGAGQRGARPARASRPPTSVAGLIAGLGLPTRLRDVGVKPEQLDRIAELSMHDRWIHTNPRKIDGPPVVRELLDAAW